LFHWKEREVTGVCSAAGVVLASFPGQRKRGRMVWYPLVVHGRNFPQILAIATVFLIKFKFSLGVYLSLHPPAARYP